MAASMRNVAGCLSRTFYNNRVPWTRHVCAYSTQTQLTKHEEVAYPPVKPKFPPGIWSEDLSLSHIWEFYENGQRLLEKQDVRERLEYIAGEQNYPMTRVMSWDHVGNNLPYVQFMTRTKIISKLPDIYDENPANLDRLMQTLKPLVIEALLNEGENIFCYGEQRKKVSSESLPEFRAKRNWSKILNLVLGVAFKDYQHLQRAQVDTDVRTAAFWRVPGFADVAGAQHKNGRLTMQYKGHRAKQIRTELPLPEFLDRDDEFCVGGEFPVVDFAPSAAGQSNFQDRPVSIAGYGIGDPCEFVQLSMEVLGSSYHRFVNKHGTRSGGNLMSKSWEQCCLVSGFSTCMAQAHNLGFNEYHELTYPITTQTIITDGSTVQFGAFQLNTVQHWQTRGANPRNNVAWVGPRLRLYDRFEEGQVKLFNDYALELFLKFVTMGTEERGYDLRPYVSGDDIPANKRLYINHKGDNPLETKKIGRWEYPRHPVYF